MNHDETHATQDKSQGKARRPYQSPLVRKHSNLKDVTLYTNVGPQPPTDPLRPIDTHPYQMP